MYFGKGVTHQEQVIFANYIHGHFGETCEQAVRLRHDVCPECGTAVGNREVAKKWLNDWLWLQWPATAAGGDGPFQTPQEEGGDAEHHRVGCEQRVPLWDELEQCFASPEIQQRGRDMQEESAIELSN